MNSKTIRKTAPAGSIAAKKNVKVKRQPESIGDRKPIPMTSSSDVTPLEADWAEQHLHGLDIKTLASTKRVLVYQTSDGRWWREPGYVEVGVDVDGEMRFLIVTYRGANRDDVSWMEKRIAQAQEGAFLRNAWHEEPLADGRARWVRRSARGYCDPFVHVDPSPEIFPCSDSRCSERWHSMLGDDHVAERIAGDGYEIEVTRYVEAGEEQESYSVYLSPDEVGFDMTPAQVASLVSDLQWAAETCKRVNATPVDSVVKGMRDPKGYWDRRNELERQQTFCFAADPIHGTNCLNMAGHSDDHQSLSERWSSAAHSLQEVV